MSGQRFFIRDIFLSMEARLVNTSSQASWDTQKKTEASLREVKNTARFLEMVHRERKQMDDDQAAVYEQVKERVLVYLLHYDRLLRFGCGDALPGDWYRSDLFRYADHTEWDKAWRQASKLFGEYIRTYQPAVADVL